MPYIKPTRDTLGETYVPIEAQVLERREVRGNLIRLQDKAGRQHKDDIEGTTAQESRRIDGGGAGDEQAKRGGGDARDCACVRA